MTPATFSCDVVVIGAGPAGSIASAQLARRGRHVLCLEGGWFPRHTIGESLLPRCNDLLADAGLLEAVERRGYQTKFGATFLRGEQRERFCFANGLGGDGVSAYQVPRDDFDLTLATGARAQGADVRFGKHVEDVTVDSKGSATLRVRDVESQETFAVRTRFVLDASGPGRVLSKLWGLERPSRLPTRRAFYTMVAGDERVAGPDEGDIWICLHPDGHWMWVIPFSDGRTSVGVVASDDAFPSSASARDNRWGAIRSDPNTQRRLRRAEPVRATGELRGWTTVTDRICGPGWALAGNAGDFLDPIFSSGVTLALESGTRAAELIHRSLAGDAVDWQQDFAVPTSTGVRVFRAFVEAWYRGDIPTIFFAPRKVEKIQRQITSILGGYVNNEQNALVRDPETGLRNLLARVDARAGASSLT